MQPCKMQGYERLVISAGARLCRVETKTELRRVFVGGVGLFVFVLFFHSVKEDLTY